jgi:hypothetical protein
VSTGALVDELAAAGIRLTPAGDDLRYQTRPGISIAPYREQIVTNKPALVSELRLREEIVAAASAAHARFDRHYFDQLWAEWQRLQNEEIRP